MASFLEAKAIITAEDHVTKVLDAIIAKVRAANSEIIGLRRAASAGSSGLLLGSTTASVNHFVEVERAAAMMRTSFGQVGSIMNRVAGDAERAARGLKDLASAEKGIAQGARSHVAATRHGGGGSSLAAGIVGGLVGHGTAHFMHSSLETYRHFDSDRRYGAAVMGITDEEQEPLIKQAIHGGATSKYNDIQWLEAQRELAARGLKVDQVKALTEVSAKLGQAMGTSLPEAAKALEGGMFGFGKDVSTYEAAVANAQRTADLQVKASKISGMGYEDVVMAYKYAAAPFRMAGLSEEQMLAFAGVGKKANMGGDEMGVAGRALVSALLSPTSGARTAMLAGGVDYSKFQRPRAMDSGVFAQDIAAKYGVVLGEEAKGAIQKVFNDKGLVADAAKFMPAIMGVLGSSLGAADAKSKKSIAGEARRFRDASMSAVDAQGLFTALLPAIAKNPALANMIFGSKQGARIRTAIGDPDVFLHKLDELVNHSQGYAGTVSDARMAGFDGAVSRFEGAVMNLQTAIGRSVDNNGKGGALTAGTDMAARFVQALAEAPPQLQRLGVEAGAAAAIFAGFKGAEALMGGFGLKGSAAALTGAAEALTAAAGKQAAANGVPGLGGGDPASRVGRVLKTLPLIATAAVAAEESLSALQDYKKAHPDQFRGGARAAHAYGLDGPHFVPQPSGHWEQASGRNKGWTRHWVLDGPAGMAPLPAGGTAGLGMLGYGAGGHLGALGGLPGGGKLEAVVTGPVTAEVKGQVEGSVTVKIEASPELKASLSSAIGGANQNFKMNVGTSAPGTGPAGRTPSGR